MGFSVISPQELEAVALSMRPGEVSEVLGTEAVLGKQNGKCQPRG